MSSKISLNSFYNGCLELFSFFIL